METTVTHTPQSDEDWEGKYNCLLQAIQLLTSPQGHNTLMHDLTVTDELLKWWKCLQRLEQINTNWRIIQLLLAEWFTGTPEEQHSHPEGHNTPDFVMLAAITCGCVLSFAVFSLCWQNRFE